MNPLVLILAGLFVAFTPLLLDDKPVTNRQMNATAGLMLGVMGFAAAVNRK